MRLEINKKRYTTWQKSKLFRSSQTLSAQCIFEIGHLGNLFLKTKVGDPANVYIGDALQFTGFVFKKYTDLKGRLILDVRDNTAKFLKLTLQPGGSEFFAISTRDLISEITGLTVTGEAGETMRHVRLNLDMPLVNIIQDLADRAGLIARANTTGGIELSSVKRSSSNFKLKEGSSLFDASHSEEWIPSSIDGKSFSSNEFDATTIVKGEGETVNNIYGYSLTSGEVSNITASKFARLNLSNVVNISVDPLKSYTPGELLNIDIPSLGLKELRIVNSVTVIQNGEDLSQFLDLVPELSYG